MRTDLALDALDMGLWARRRTGQDVSGLVHHSDCGYTSLAFSSRLADLELDQSFSAVGSCYDNAAVESFFATLKRELAWIHQRSTWPTRAALRTALFDYIEGFYNLERIQQRLDHRSPTHFENHAVA